MTAYVSYHLDLDDWYFKSEQLFGYVQSHSKHPEDGWMKAVSE